MQKLKDRLQVIRNQDKAKGLESAVSALDAQPSPDLGMPETPEQLAAVAKTAKATPPKADLGASGGVKKTKRALHRMVDRALQRDFHGLDVVENSKKALKKGAHALIEGKKIHFAPGMLSDLPNGQDLLRHEGMIQEVERQLKNGADLREVAERFGKEAGSFLKKDQNDTAQGKNAMAGVASGFANVVAEAGQNASGLVNSATQRNQENPATSAIENGEGQGLPSAMDLLDKKVPVKNKEDIQRNAEQQEETQAATEQKERDQEPEKEAEARKKEEKEKEGKEGEGGEGEGAEKDGEKASKEAKEEGKQDGKKGGKDRQAKADKKKGKDKKGKKGAGKDGEDKQGDEAQNAAAEGAGQEIQNQVDSSTSQVGQVAQQSVEGGAEGPASENSGPAQLSMTIANAPAIEAAGVQGNVIKEAGTNEEGEAVFVVAGPVDIAAAGDAGDGKPKPRVKQMPGDIQGEMEAANREKIDAAIAEFQSSAAGEVGQLSGLGASASGQVTAGAESAKGSVLAAAASQKAAITAAIAAQKASVQAGAETAKAQAQSALEAQMAALAAGAESAKAELEAQFAAQDAALGAMEGEMTGKISSAVEKAKADITQVGDTKAAEAIAQGEVRAAGFAAEPLDSQSGWEDFKNGSDYPKNKRDAKVNAAKATAKKFADSFKEKAAEAVAKIGGEALSQLNNYITQSVAGGKQAIAQRKTAAIAAVDSSRSSTEAQLQSSHQTTVASIDASAQSTLASLDQQQGGAMAQVEGSAQGRVAGISQAAAQTAAQLQQQAQQAHASMNEQIAAAVAAVKARKEQNPVAIKQALAQSLEAIRSGVAQARTSVEGMASESAAGFQQQASEGAAEMAQQTSQVTASAQSTATGAISGMTAQAGGFASSAASQVATATAGMTQQATQAGSEMGQHVAAIRTDFEGTIGKLVAQFATDKTAFNSTLQGELGKLDAEITKQAKEAADAVQPRWKAIVMFVVNIVVMILVTVAVIAAFASGGILLAIGVALLAGAAGGVLKYCVQQGIDGKPITAHGVASAAFEGAMDGLEIAAGVVGGPAAEIVAGAVIGAAKYAGGYAIDYAFASPEERAKMQFSYMQMGAGAVGGLINGIAGAAGGKYADGLGGGLTNYVKGKVVEAAADTVAGGLAAPFEHFADTGEWDMNKLYDAFKPENLASEFATNFATNVVVDKAVGRATRNITTPNSNSSTPETNNSANSANPVAPTNTPATPNPVAPTNTPATPNPVAPTNTPATPNPVAPTNTPATPNPVAPTNTPATPNPVTPTNKKPDTDTKTPETDTKTPETDTKTPETDTKKPETDTKKPEAETKPADDGRSKPPAEAPVGYHWKLRDGKYILSRNPNMADSLPPLTYDPKTGGFVNKDTGQPHTGDMTANTVRGQDMKGFVESVKGLDPNSPVAKEAFELYATKKWSQLEALFKKNNLNDGWPPNRGFISVKVGELPVGAKFDRFGGYIDRKSGQWTDTGNFVAPYGSDYTGRALPKGTDSKDFKGYEVIKPIPMKEGPAIPWFGEKGNGMQYELDMNIQALKDGGYIREITAPDLNAIKDKGTTSTTSTTTTPETTTSDASKTETPVAKPETTATPENTDATKTEGEDGGGMMSKFRDAKNVDQDVYAPRPGQPKIKDIASHSDATQMVVDAITPGSLVHGATIAREPGTTSTVNMVVNGVKVTVSVFRGRNKDFTGSVHGAQQGPAINKVEWKQGPDGTWGWFAKITINEASEQADINKMAVHEFNEVADIVAREDANVQNGTHNDPSGVFDPTKLNGAVSGHQQASVFKQGANPATVNPANLSSHDLAAAKELQVVMNEAEAALGTPDEGRQLTRVRQLMESMGMLHTGAPQFAMLAAPPINMSIPPKVKAYLDTHVGKDADQQMLMNKFHTHVKTLDWNGKTISGGHDHSVFQAEVAANAHKIQVDAAPVPGLQAGVLTYTYRPKDAAGVVDMDPSKAKKKTTYDPSIWPDSRLINSATEAFASRTYGNDPDIGDYWEGTASDGSKIRGLFTGTPPNIQVTTFWPL